MNCLSLVLSVSALTFLTASPASGSGGYKTNRGEAHLKSDDYAQTRSVYENSQVEETKTEEPTSKPGAMPKGWKPE